MFHFAHKWANEKFKAAAWGYKHFVPTALKTTLKSVGGSTNFEQSCCMAGYVVNSEPAFTLPKLFTRPVIGDIAQPGQPESERSRTVIPVETADHARLCEHDGPDVH